MWQMALHGRAQAKQTERKLVLMRAVSYVLWSIVSDTDGGQDSRLRIPDLKKCVITHTDYWI
jgi:hypothetical protein